MTFSLCNKRKKKLIDNGIDRIKRELDITIILSKLFEIETLKTLLLDEQQLMLFEHTSRPIVHYKRDRPKSHDSPMIQSSVESEFG